MQIHLAKFLPTALLVACLAGCGGSSSDSSDRPSGTIDIDGSSTVFKISKAVQEAYNKVNPDVQVVVNNSGTGGGFSHYLAGEVDIVDASRPAKSDEEAKAKAQGIDWTRFTVAYDGIAVVVNTKNDFVKALTVDQLRAIYSPDSTIKTWKDLDPSWPDRKLILYSPDRDSGTHEFFAEAIIGGGKKVHRLDLQASPDDNILVRGVGGDVDGLGYFGYAYAKENADTLRIVPIKVDAKAPAVSPDPETILKKTYSPLSRPLFLYVKNSAMRRPEVSVFVNYYLGNLGNLVPKAGYVPPTPEDEAANKAAIKGEKPGTDPKVG